MNIQIECTITHVFDVEHVGSKSTPKRVFWAKYNDGKFEQPLKFETFNPALIDGLSKAHEGKLRVVHFNLRGRIYDGKNGKEVLNSLAAWKIERTAAHAAAPKTPPPPPPPVEPELDSDELPF